MRTAEERWIPLNFVQPFTDKGYHQTNLASYSMYSNTQRHQLLLQCQIACSSCCLCKSVFISQTATLSQSKTPFCLMFFFFLSIPEFEPSRTYLHLSVGHHDAYQVAVEIPIHTFATACSLHSQWNHSDDKLVSPAHATTSSMFPAPNCSLNAGKLLLFCFFFCEQSCFLST